MKTELALERLDEVTFVSPNAVSDESSAGGHHPGKVVEVARTPDRRRILAAGTVRTISCRRQR